MTTCMLLHRVWKPDHAATHTTDHRTSGFIHECISAKLLCKMQQSAFWTDPIEFDALQSVVLIVSMQPAARRSVVTHSISVN